MKLTDALNQIKAKQHEKLADRATKKYLQSTTN